MKKIIMLILVSFNLLLLFGCGLFERTEKYSGEYPELYTVACNSIITEGYFQEDHFELSAEVFVIEEDNYGRKMFIYTDNDFYHRPESSKRLFVLIAQYSKDDYVYYYPYYNFIVLKELTGKYNVLKMEDIEMFFNKIPQKDVENLKKWNDWNKQIDESKCIKSPITNHYNDSFRDYDYDYTTITKDEMSHGYVVSVDSYGNKLLFVRDLSNHISCLYIVSKSGKCNRDLKLLYENYNNENYTTGFYLPFTTNYEYQQKLKKFKEDNYWNVKDLDEVI